MPEISASELTLLVLIAAIVIGATAVSAFGAGTPHGPEGQSETYIRVVHGVGGRTQR
jgi:hypothetical protein